MYKKKILFGLILLLIALPLVAQEEDEDVYVERIEIRGNNRISTETIIYYMETREGDLYSEQTLRSDFQALWKTGFFSDLKIKVADGEEGKVVLVEVEEQKIMNQVSFEGLEAVSTSDVLESLERGELTIKPGSYLNLGLISEVKKVLLEILDLKGYKSATCDYRLVDLGKGKVDVVFDIVEGRTIIIEEIRFDGNRRFSDWQIRNSMEELSNRPILSFLTEKDVFNEIKFYKDRQHIRDLYWKHGYLDVRIFDPKFESIEGMNLFKDKKEKRAVVIVPIEEGGQYKVGNITIEGNTEFDDEMILSALTLRKGEIYNHEKVKNWKEFLQRQYGRRGYVALSIEDKQKKDIEKKIVDLHLNIKEYDIYYVNRIEFTGNTVTNDEVVRRQMLLEEGDVFDAKLLELSIRRIQQLGFFEPAIQPEPKELPGNKVDVGIKLQERGSTNINFGIAYSELEGFFGNVSVQTKNLFGSGNSFGIAGQFGKLTSMFSFNFYDPWFLGQHVGFGASVFIRDYDFPGYIDKRVGGTANISYPILPFLFGRISYSYQVANIQFPEITDEEELDPYSRYYSFYYRQFAYSRFLYPEGDTVISSVSNSIIWNTIDHPLFPRSGWKVMASLEYGGGPLGGSIDFLKGTGEVVKFFSPFRRNIIGVRTQFGWVESLNDAQIPVFERYFLGGDRSIRILPIRSVGGELNENNIPIGGTKMFLLNLEYQIEISNEMRLVLFFDAGNAWSENQDFDFNDLRKTAGVEGRIFLPVFNVPIRLIFGFNLDPREREKSSDFQFAMGLMF